MVRILLATCLCWNLTYHLWSCEQKETTKVQWAREIADNFFDAVFDKDQHIYNAIALLSQELADAEKRDHINAGPVSQLFFYKSATITQERTDPDQSEVILSGTLQGEEKESKATFSMRVAKESSGRWTIRYIRVKTMR